MKKTILALVVMVALASCGGTATIEVPKTDSTVVVITPDTTVAASVKVDTTKK